MKKIKVFKDNSQSRRISDHLISLRLIFYESSSSDDSNIAGFFFQMLRHICYFPLSHQPKNLSNSITFDRFLLETLDYYLASVSTTTQK